MEIQERNAPHRNHTGQAGVPSTRPKCQSLVCHRSLGIGSRTSTASKEIASQMQQSESHCLSVCPSESMTAATYRIEALVQGEFPKAPLVEQK
jgi:hypothetical protein